MLVDRSHRLDDARRRAGRASGPVWYLPPPVKPLLIACDFDGTITQRDALHVIVDQYGERDLWATLGPRVRRGEMTVEQAMQEEFSHVRATAAQVRDAVREHAPVRDGFHDFVAWCEALGHRLLVLSNGFRSIIEPVLADVGLERLEVVSNDARFGPNGAQLVWADRGPRCLLCDRPCKRQPLRQRWDGERLVYVGDGISDRCASLLADVVFARDGLAEHLEASGVPFAPFDDFHDVRAALADPAGVRT
jgi:2-hydroxy-3-keto-5-methylthiopentenyl-1-phosphate phosphatase